MFIRMIGVFEVRDADGVDRAPRGMKARALLAMLARTPGHCRPRRWLESRLWSDRGPEQASGSLRQALTELRKALGPLADRLTSDRDLVALGAFDSDLADPRLVRDALSQGREFLEGVDVADAAFLAWLTEERNRLATEHSSALRPAPQFSLTLADLPAGTDAAIARDLSAAIARLAAQFLLGESGRGTSGDRLPDGLHLLVEGDWSEDRAWLKVQLLDPVNRRTVWNQRLVASRQVDRADMPQIVYEATEAKLM